MDHSATDKNGLPWRKLRLHVAYPQHQAALHAVERFIPVLVIVRHRHLTTGADGHLEHVRAPSGVVLVVQKGDSQPRVSDPPHRFPPFPAPAATDAPPLPKTLPPRARLYCHGTPGS